MTSETPLFALADARVVVTGGSRGIGLGIARTFARAGARVLIAARDQHAASEAARAIGGDSGRIIAAGVDVGDLGSCRALADTAQDAFDGVDVVCANAGVFPSATLDELTPSDLAGVVSTNLLGTVYTVQAFLPALRRSRRGRVVLTSSITGPLTGYAGWSHYGATKAAQLGFMRTAALELAPAGVTINAVLPGNVRTEGLDDLGEDYLAAMTASIPLGRLGSVDDIGAAAAFLASREAAFITGQTLVVDGGQVLPESLDAMAAR